MQHATEESTLFFTLERNHQQKDHNWSNLIVALDSCIFPMDTITFSPTHMSAGAYSNLVPSAVDIVQPDDTPTCTIVTLPLGSPTWK